MDWNGDGKHDWQDDAIFHNVINTDNDASIVLQPAADTIPVEVHLSMFRSSAR